MPRTPGRPSLRCAVAAEAGYTMNLRDTCLPAKDLLAVKILKKEGHNWVTIELGLTRPTDVRFVHDNHIILPYNVHLPAVSTAPLEPSPSLPPSHPSASLHAP